jgi:hypothetical protein
MRPVEAIDRVFRLPLAADIYILVSMRRRIPYAVANYEEIIRNKYYFLDKTRFIHEIEQYKILVFLRLRLLYWCHGILVL